MRKKGLLTKSKSERAISSTDDLKSSKDCGRSSKSWSRTSKKSKDSSEDLKSSSHHRTRSSRSGPSRRDDLSSSRYRSSSRSWCTRTSKKDDDKDLDDLNSSRNHSSSRSWSTRRDDLTSSRCHFSSRSWTTRTSKKNDLDLDGSSSYHSHSSSRRGQLNSSSYHSSSRSWTTRTSKKNDKGVDDDLKSSSYHSHSSRRGLLNSSGYHSSSRSWTTRTSKKDDNEFDGLKSSSCLSRSSSNSIRKEEEKKKKESLKRRHTMSNGDIGSLLTRIPKGLLEGIDEDAPVVDVATSSRRRRRSAQEFRCVPHKDGGMGSKRMYDVSGLSGSERSTGSDRYVTDESMQDVSDHSANLQFSLRHWKDPEQEIIFAGKGYVEVWEDDEPTVNQPSSQPTTTVDLTIPRATLRNRLSTAWDKNNKYTKQVCGFILICKLLIVILAVAMVSFHLLSSLGKSSSSSSSSSSLRGSPVPPKDIQVLHFQMIFFEHTMEEDGHTVDEIQHLMCSVNAFLQERATGSTTAIKHINWIDGGSTMTFRFTAETNDADLVTTTFLRKDFQYQTDYNKPELLNYLKSKRATNTQDFDGDRRFMASLGTRVSLEALTPEHAALVEEVQEGAMKELQCNPDPTDGIRF